MKTFHALPRALQPLNIFFEDVLGRRHNLPWHYFRHWRVGYLDSSYAVRSLIDIDFSSHVGKGIRGPSREEKVKRGDFRIMNAQSYSRILTKRNWEESLSPGSEIVMSVLMESLTVRYDRCYRDGYSGKLDMTCPSQTRW